MMMSADKTCLLIQKIMSSYISGEPEKIRDVMGLHFAGYSGDRNGQA